MKKLNIGVSYQIYPLRTSTVGYDVLSFPGPILVPEHTLGPGDAVTPSVVWGGHLLPQQED